MTLPPGSYLAEARLGFHNNGSQWRGVDCRLPGGGTSSHRLEPENNANGTENPVERSDMEITSAFNHVGGEIAVQCRNNGGPGGDTVVWTVSLLVTKVDSVNGGGIG
jgi:hypothetical protein